MYAIKRCVERYIRKLSYETTGERKITCIVLEIHVARIIRYHRAATAPVLSSYTSVRKRSARDSDPHTRMVLGAMWGDGYYRTGMIAMVRVR